MEFTGPFRMTDALRRTFAIAFGEIGVLLPLVFLVLLPQFLLTALWIASVWDQPAAVMDPQWTVTLVQAPLSVVLKQLAVAAVIPLVFARLRRERRASPGQAVRRAARRLLPLLGLAILVGLAVFTGLLLCFVPGIIVYCALFVATPALMVEDVGVFDAWQRSLRLTEGYRWEIFGVVFVIWAIGAVLSAFSMAALPFLLADPEGFMPRYLAITGVLGVLVGLVSTLLTAVAATVVYHDLRQAREGLGEDDLLAVFE